jgi:hypothetical protein
MKADLHIHTTFSDGCSSPEEVIKTALERNIDCVCITDHKETEGAVRAIRFGFDKNILVVPGIEIATKSGHMLGLNVKKIIPDGLDPETAVREIKKQGGLAVVAHPFDWPLEDFLGGEEKIRALGFNLVGIEVFNASVLIKSSNQKAFSFAQKNNFCFTAGSDAHRKEFVGRGYLEFQDNVQSAEDLLEVIRKRTAQAKGEVLSFWELLKMVRHNSFTLKDLFRFYKLRRRMERLNNLSRSLI